MKRRRILTLLAFCMALVIAAAVFSSCRKKQLTPLEYLNLAAEKTMAEKKTDTTFWDLLTAAENGGSVSLSIKGTDAMKNMGIPLDEMSFKYAMKDDQFSGNLSVTAEGENTTFGVFGKGTEFALSSSLFDKVYGLDSAKAGDTDFLDTLGIDLESLEAMFGTSIETEELQKLLEEYGEKLTDILEKDVVSALETTEEGKTVTLEITTENLKKMLQTLYAEAKDDKELREVLVDYLTSLKSAYGDEEFPADEMIENYDEFFASEEKLNELLAELDKVDFTLRLTVTTDTKDIICTAELYLSAVDKESEEAVEMKASLAFEESGEEEKVVFSLDLDVPDPDYSEDSIEYSTISDTSVTITYTVLSDTEDTYSSNISVYSSGVTLDLIDLTYDKKSGAYELSSKVLSSSLMGGSGSPISVKGVYKADKASATVTVTELTVPGMLLGGADTTLPLDISMVILASDTVEEMPAYTDILSLTEEQLEEIGTQLEELFGGFSGSAEEDYYEDYDEEDLFADLTYFKSNYDLEELEALFEQDFEDFGDFEEFYRLYIESILAEINEGVGV